jgi:hypothetical protein
MELYNKFTSNQNKGMVWKLLCDYGIFNTIPEHKAPLVKDAFDKKFEMLSKQITPMDNLANLDKRIIEEMMYDLNNFAKEEIYNAAEIAENRKKAFQEELKNKQKEFDKLNKITVPDKIDFSDNLDAPMGSEMDKILAEQVALREKQLNMVLKNQDKEAANKWIQNPGDPKETVKLKIGENIDMKEPAKAKKVVFAETIETDNFMALLKKKEPEDTLTLLREILDKQNQILEILKPKN